MLKYIKIYQNIYKNMIVREGVDFGQSRHGAVLFGVAADHRQQFFGTGRPLGVVEADT